MNRIKEALDENGNLQIWKSGQLEKSNVMENGVVEN
jgi:hypothetical protein